jgi:hypothetical protein
MTFFFLDELSLPDGDDDGAALARSRTYGTWSTIDEDSMSYDASWSISTRASTDCSSTISRSIESAGSSTIRSLESSRSTVESPARWGHSSSQRTAPRHSQAGVCHAFLFCEQLPDLTEEDILDRAACLDRPSLLDLREEDDDCDYKEDYGEYGRDNDDRDVVVRSQSNDDTDERLNESLDRSLLDLREDDDCDYKEDYDDCDAIRPHADDEDTDERLNEERNLPVIEEGVVHLRHKIDADEDVGAVDSKSFASQTFSAIKRVTSFSTTFLDKGAISAHTQTSNRPRGSTPKGDEDDDIHHHDVAAHDVYEHTNKDDDDEDPTGNIIVQKFRALEQTGNMLLQKLRALLGNDTMQAVFVALDHKTQKKEQWIALKKSIKSVRRKQNNTTMGETAMECAGRFKQNIRETAMAYVGQKQNMRVTAMAYAGRFKPPPLLHRPPCSDTAAHPVVVNPGQQECFETTLDDVIKSAQETTTAIKKSSALRNKVLLSQSLTGKAAKKLLWRERLHKKAAAG